VSKKYYMAVRNTEEEEGRMELEKERDHERGVRKISFDNGDMCGGAFICVVSANIVH
jgi:hypothetical protein